MYILDLKIHLCLLNNYQATHIPIKNYKLFNTSFKAIVEGAKKHDIKNPSIIKIEHRNHPKFKKTMHFPLFP